MTMMAKLHLNPFNNPKPQRHPVASRKRNPDHTASPVYVRLGVRHIAEQCALADTHNIQM